VRGAGPPRILVEAVYPELDDGRYPIKRVVGDTLAVWADIVRDGHDVLVAAIRYRTRGETTWREAPMRHVHDDRFAGAVPLTENTRYVYTIEAWTDRFASWAQALARRVEAGREVGGDLAEGAALVRHAAARAADPDRAALERAAAILAGDGPEAARVEAALDPALAGLIPAGRSASTRAATTASSRSSSTGRPPASRPGTPCSRARRAACPGGAGPGTTASPASTTSGPWASTSST
jgi:starch synthase (maltosyl-transferring)